MNERNLNIVRSVLSRVDFAELFASQVKAQIDDSQAAGEPMVPLWADRVAFRLTERGTRELGAMPTFPKPERRSGVERAYRKAIKQLKRVRGKGRKLARLVKRLLSKKARKAAASRRARASRNAKGATRKPPKPKAYTYSYRRGGKPLLDTRTGYAGIHATDTKGKDEVIVSVTAPAYMVLQHRGFSTKGPNFVPLTLKAKREHAKGRDPKSEGLKKGEDYWMFWRGVRVPARPFAVLGPKYAKRFARTISLAMRAQTNG